MYIKILLNSVLKTIKAIDRLQLILYILIVLSIISFFCAFKTIPSNVYYYDKQTDQVTMKAQTMNQPVRNIGTVTTNVSKALTETFNFDSNNYDEVLDKATDKWYTKEGGEQLISQMAFNLMKNQSLSFLELVETKRLTVQAYVLPNTSVIQSTRDSNTGRLTWHIGAQILFTYRNSLGVGVSEKKDVSVWVIERDSSSFPTGLGIRNLNIL